MADRNIRFPSFDDVHLIHAEIVAADPVDRRHADLMRGGESILRSILDECRPPDDVDDDDLLRAAACIILRLNRSHVYDAGNKRTALVTAMSFLKDNGWEFAPPDEDARRFMLDVREQFVSLEQVEEWVRRWAKRDKV